MLQAVVRYEINVFVVEWGEAVEGLAGAVVDNRVHVECADVRRTSEFLAHRILRSLLIEMRQEKQRVSLFSNRSRKIEYCFFKSNKCYSRLINNINFTYCLQLLKRRYTYILKHLLAQIKKTLVSNKHLSYF